MTKTLKELNKYIKENCVCDGNGPLDSMRDTGKYEGITESDIPHILKILSKLKESK